MRPLKPYRSLTAALLPACLLIGCAVGPNYSAPPTAAVGASGAYRTTAAPADAVGTRDPDTKPTRELLGSSVPSDIAQLQFRASTPIMALVLTLVAVPLSRLRPRQGRYARVGFAIVVYFVYSNLLSAAKAWLEKGDLPPAIGVWWVHLAALALGLYLVMREARTA